MLEVVFCNFQKLKSKSISFKTSFRSSSFPNHPHDIFVSEREWKFTKTEFVIIKLLHPQKILIENFDPSFPLSTPSFSLLRSVANFIIQIWNLQFFNYLVDSNTKQRSGWADLNTGKWQFELMLRKNHL